MTRAEFAKEILGVYVWALYKDVFDAIEAGETKIAIRSANGIGKTKLLSTLVAYEFLEPANTTCILTGGSFTQLRDTTWKESKKACRQLKNLRGIELKIDEREIRRGEQQFAVPISPAKVESGQGYHNERVAIFLDEATKLSASIITALISNCTGENSLIIITYNPLDSDAAIFDIEENAASNGFKVFSVSAFDHPNVKEGADIIPGAASRSFVEMELRRDSIQVDQHYPGAIHVPWDNTFWNPTAEALARVCGVWSFAPSHGLIPGKEIVECCGDNVEYKVGMTCAGIDVASTGEDKTAITIFSGNKQRHIQTLKSGEFSVVAEWLAGILKQYEVEAAAIDDAGVGHAVSERLTHLLSHNTLIIPVNFGSKPKGFEAIRKPANARAEMYMCLEREVRDRAISLLYDKDQIKEIGAARTVPMKNSELIRLEDKIIIKRRLGRSPDLADAVALARYCKRLVPFINRPKLLL